MAANTNDDEKMIIEAPGVDAGAESVSSDQAIEWVKSQVGKSIDADGAYGAQCVDLILAYYDYLGVPRSSGNAVNYTTNALPNGWQRLQGVQPQKGDILVYTSGYGHVAIYESDRSTYHQNFNSHSYVEKVTYAYNGLSNPYWGVIRPNFGNGVINISYTNVKTTTVDNWNAVLHGEIQNPNRATVASVGAYVWDSAGNLVVNHFENCGLTATVVTQNLNIVTEALPGGLSSGVRYTYQLFANVNGQTFKSTIGSFTTVDTVSPEISDVTITDVDSNGYTVNCTVKDNVGIKEVKFPTWTSKDNQDDIVWGTPTAISGNQYSYRVNISDHNGEHGYYITHIYAYDTSGNSKIYECNSVKIIDDLKVRIVSSQSEYKVGDKINITASATGGSGSYTYKYVMKNAATGKLVTLKDYNSSAVYTGSLVSKGTKEFIVYVKDSNGAETLSNTIKVIVEDEKPLAAKLRVNGTTDNQILNAGKKVTLTAGVSGGTGNYTYKYVMKNMATGAVITLKDYSTSTSYTGPLTTAGSKQFTMYVKDSKGTLVASNTITVLVPKTLAAKLRVNGSTDNQTLAAGNKVTLTAGVSGGVAKYTYKYVMKTTSGTVVTLKDYSNSTSYTGPLVSKGIKEFTMYVKDATGTVVASNTVSVTVS